SYGFVGPVMVELKLLHNPEILVPQERAQYKTKIKQYLAGSYSEYGIYLVFKVKNNAAHDAAFKDLQKEYKDIEALDVKKIDCCSL
ncbi:MAG: hypothetical protein JWQ14_2168, partial [Adhaeribacter sp.]|nr:hypothetical protein [Adhaeribacter sp.]